MKAVLSRGPGCGGGGRLAVSLRAESPRDIALLHVLQFELELSYVDETHGAPMLSFFPSVEQSAEIPAALLSVIEAAFRAACDELHEMELACKQRRAPRNPELTEAALASIAAALKEMNDAKQSR